MEMKLVLWLLKIHYQWKGTKFLEKATKNKTFWSEFPV